MASAVDGIFKNELRDLIKESKLLVVGAGGIGCEILKNLVMCGFKDIEIVSCFVICFVITRLTQFSYSSISD